MVNIKEKCDITKNDNIQHIQMIFLAAYSVLLQLVNILSYTKLYPILKKGMNREW